MKTLSKSVLAVAGLALSLAACAPAMKGQGAKQPNIHRAFLKTVAEDYKKLEKLPQIKAIKFGEKDKNFLLAEVELENTADLKDDQKKLSAMVKLQEKVLGEADSAIGEQNVYSVELMCLENECNRIAAVLTSKPKTAADVAKETSTEEKAEVKAEEVKTEEKSDLEIGDTKEETKVATQAGTTAPDQLPQTVEDSLVVKTGVIVDASGEVLHAEVFEDVAATALENVLAMEAKLTKANSIGLLKTKIEKK